MNALKRLEKGGIRFELTAEGEIACYNTWPGDVPREWVDPLLAEARARRDEVAAILRYRQAWIEVFDQWSALPATQPATPWRDDPQPADPQRDDPQRDIDFLRRLESLAIAGLMPCYDGGEADLGADGWRMVTDRQIQAIHDSDKEKQDMGIKIEQTTFDAVPTGDYKAVIIDVSAVEGKFGPQLQIKCEINDGPCAGNTFLCWVSPRFSPRSRLYEWVEAAMAMAVPKTYTFDSDHLIGREVIATLVVRELDGGGEVNRVDRVRGVRKEQERPAFG